MPNIVLQLEKEGHNLHFFTLQDSKISKQSIEKAVFESTGLRYDQYDVLYVDSQNDLIMTVVEQDYSIAEMTLEGDTIVFHIDVKGQVDKNRLIKFSQEKSHQKEKNEQYSSSQDDDVSQQQKVDQVYKSAISSDNQAQPLKKVPEQTDLQEDILPFQIKNQQVQQDIFDKVNVQQAIEQRKEKVEVETQNKQQQKNQTQKSNSGDEECDFQGLNQQNQEQEKEDTYRLAPQTQISKQQSKEGGNITDIQKYLEDPQVQQILFNKFAQKLTTILKPECFITHQEDKVSSQLTKKDQICLVCQLEITKTPYYINPRNQLICQLCEPEYERTQNLVKVRNQQSQAELFAAKYLTLSYNQLSRQDLHQLLRETDPKHRQSKVDQLFIQKLRPPHPH